MKYLISGHRKHKLVLYSEQWVKMSIANVVDRLRHQGLLTFGLSGMAGGVDLWFCEALLQRSIPYTAMVPFDEQEETVDVEDRELRRTLIAESSNLIRAKNSIMVEKADAGIIVFDGNKGGTHNVFQQMVEKKKPFVWINPVNQKIYDIV